MVSGNRDSAGIKVRPYRDRTAKARSSKAKGEVLQGAPQRLSA